MTVQFTLITITIQKNAKNKTKKNHQFKLVIPELHEVIFQSSPLYAPIITNIREKSNSTGNPTLTTGNAPDSICPYGWRLPGDEGDGSFNELMKPYSSSSGNASFKNIETTAKITPFVFLCSGWYYSSGSPSNQTSHGYYWSSKRDGNTNASLLYFLHLYLGPRYRYARGYGFSLRCLARQIFCLSKRIRQKRIVNIN